LTFIRPNKLYIITELGCEEEQKQIARKKEAYCFDNQFAKDLETNHKRKGRN
jgi:hypothetical protein